MMISLSSIFDEAKQILAGYLWDYEPSLDIVWGQEHVEVKGAAYSIWMTFQYGVTRVRAGDYFFLSISDPEAAADCFMWLMTPAYRLLEQWCGGRCVAAGLEFFDREWSLYDGFQLVGNPSQSVKADRTIVKHQALIRPPKAYVDERNGLLDREGVPLGSVLGVSDEASKFDYVANDTPFHRALWQILDGAEDDCGYERLDGEQYVSVWPYDPSGFQITVDARGNAEEPATALLRAYSAGCVLSFDDAVDAAGRLAMGFGRVVETYFLKWLRSSVIECYRGNEWVPISAPFFPHELLSLTPPTSKFVLQQRLRTASRFVPGPEYTLGEDGLPPNSFLGKKRIY